MKGASTLDVSAGVAQTLTLIKECLFILSTSRDIHNAHVNEELETLVWQTLD